MFVSECVEIKKINRILEYTKIKMKKKLPGLSAPQNLRCWELIVERTVKKSV
ncbi:hypothetical protein LSS_22715 [Leptospira santarosai serovar Shermani str. LT 821]|uniref:Uncharacterized protein n=1 Tax=Leptospira santarosai serovar Shermani str. LT 821 TaxID=758847 RepID=A0A097ESW8_9LEPT|nr:hypothetical protein LSS_22715 [Leptospira santarosai serovar Shermani str. LT 821]